MPSEKTTETVLSGLENVAAFCIGLGLLLGFVRRVVFQFPSRLGVWMMLLGLAVLVLVVVFDRAR